MDDGWAVAMMIGMLATWLLLAVALVWVIRSSMPPKAVPPGAGEPARSTARDVTSGAERILAERLAGGEIGTDEYETRLRALAAGQGRP